MKKVFNFFAVALVATTLVSCGGDKKADETAGADSTATATDSTAEATTTEAPAADSTATATTEDTTKAAAPAGEAAPAPKAK